MLENRKNMEMAFLEVRAFRRQHRELSNGRRRRTARTMGGVCWMTSAGRDTFDSPAARVGNGGARRLSSFFFKGKNGPATDCKTWTLGRLPNKKRRENTRSHLNVNEALLLKRGDTSTRACRRSLTPP